MNETLLEPNKQSNFNFDLEKKTKKNSKRLRDIKRLLSNKKIVLNEEKRIELENEIKEIEKNISKSKSSYQKKLNKYLQFKRNKQKTMRFVELVKVKRKINQLQKKLILLLQDEDNNSEISKIRSEIKLYKTYEDYIRLSPFFKERKYIPLFSNTQLDSDTISKRNQFIEDVKKLKDKLRIKKCKISDVKDFDSKDYFLLTEQSDENSQKYEKIEYNINISNKKSNKRSNKKVKTNKKSNDNKDHEVKGNGQNHIIFLDSD